jgi:hypothetical protein
MWIFISQRVLVTSIRNPISCEASATLGWEMLETLYPATAAIRRTFFDVHNPATVAEQLTIQHSHHGSLENVVTTGRPPDTSTR